MQFEKQPKKTVVKGKEGRKENLILINEDSARAMGMAGLQSWREIKHRRGSIRESMMAILQGKTEVDGVEMSFAEAVALAQVKKAIETGDTSSAVFARDTIGEKPTDHIATSQDAPFEVHIEVIK